MIFAAPVIRRAAYAAPRAADIALQRFLQGTLNVASHDVKVSQDEKATTLQLDVPGLSRAQLQLSLEGAVVRLSSVEDAPRKVQRAWELSHEIDTSASHARLENGVLTLTLAKLEPQSKATVLSID